MLIKKIKSFLEIRINKYFPAVRWPVILIVIPALLIGTYTLLHIFSEVAIQNKRSRTVAYMKRLAPVQKDLPAYAYVSYVSDQEYSGDYILARYALIPARIVKGIASGHEYLVAQYLESANIPQFEGYTMKKNYQNGVMLFQRSR